MNTKLILAVAVVVATVPFAFVVISGVSFPDSNHGFLDKCTLIRGNNDTFYVINDCTLRAFEPIKPTVSFYSLDVNRNFKEATKIRDACIPVSGFDVDEIPDTLVIYLTEQNAQKYADKINKTIDTPYVIKTTERRPNEPDAWRRVQCYVTNLLGER